jgi:GxxExxY protein
MALANFARVDLTKTIIGDFYHVYNELGYGFLEKVYENSLAITLKKSGLSVTQQVPIDVYFEGDVVGQYEADLAVNDLVILELKAARVLNPDHEAQLLNYLKATRYEVGLLLNFGATKAEMKRKAFSNTRKGSLSWAKPK